MKEGRLWRGILLMTLGGLVGLGGVSLYHQARRPEPVGSKIYKALRAEYATVEVGYAELQPVVIPAGGEQSQTWKPVLSSDPDTLILIAGDWKIVGLLARLWPAREKLRDSGRAALLQRALYKVGYVGLRPQELVAEARQGLQETTDAALLRELMQADAAGLRETADPVRAIRLAELMLVRDFEPIVYKLVPSEGRGRAGVGNSAEAVAGGPKGSAAEITELYVFEPHPKSSLEVLECRVNWLMLDAAGQARGYGVLTFPARLQRTVSSPAESLPLRVLQGFLDQFRGEFVKTGGMPLKYE